MIGIDNERHFVQSKKEKLTHFITILLSGVELESQTPKGRFELPRCKTPVVFETTAFPD